MWTLERDHPDRTLRSYHPLFAIDAIISTPSMLLITYLLSVRTEELDIDTITFFRPTEHSVILFLFYHTVTSTFPCSSFSS
jgi:hypothetical protein